MHITKRILTVMLAVCLLVSALPVSATAEETTYYCGKHVHDESCYGSVKTCTQDEHTHGDECAEVKDLTCGKDEVPAHTHGDECGESCTLTQAHEHEDGCTVEGSLTCGHEEVHAHDDTCYTVARAACTETVHTHTPEQCFESQLTCGVESDHVHENACKVAPPAACNKEEACPASTHEEGCLKAAAEKAAAEAAEREKCDQQATCTAALHKENCLKAFNDAELAKCNMEETCEAQVHKEGCLKAVNATNDEVCTEADGCTATTHKDTCPLYVWTCDGTENCKAAANHSENCVKAATDLEAAELAKCGLADPCEATVHKDTCPLYVWLCDGTKECKATDHAETCPAPLWARFEELLADLPAPETVDPLDEESLEPIHQQIAAIVQFALDNQLYATQDEVTCHPIIAALLEAMTPTQTTEYDWYTEAEDGTYEISTIEELKELALITQGKAKDADGKAIAKDNFSGKTVKLMNDLSFDADDYWYVKDASNNVKTNYCIYDFAGTFNGNNSTIFGLKMKAERGTSQIGLFRNIVAGGSITGLTLDGVRFDLTDGNSSIGSIAGQLRGTATNCHVKNVTVVVGMRNETRGYIAQGGGMFGYIGSATVTGCTATTVNMTFSGKDNTDRVGALIGQADGSTDNRSTISGCTVTGATFNCTCKTKHFGAFVGQTHHTDVTNCHISNINITTQTYSYNTGGFVGNVGTGSVFSTCTVTGFNMIDNASNGIAGNVGGFAGYVGGTDISFTGCSATGLEFDLEFANDYDFGVGGFAGKVGSNGATFSGCSASGNINAHSTGNADIPVGGFIGESNGNLTVSDCDTSVNTTAPEVAGGFVGACNQGTDTYTNCVVTGSVTSTEGVAGGMAGYVKDAATPSFGEGCDPAPSVTGPITSDVAYSQNKIYDQDADGDITSESTSWVCSVKLNRSYTIGYPSIQAAVDAGADNVTLLQNVTGDFSLDRTKDDSFTLNLGEFTFNGKVHIHDMLGSFAVTGNAEGSQILLTAPLGIHDAFDGWCRGSNDVNEFADKADKDHWIAVPGNTYHIHYHETDLGEIEAAQRHLDLGRMAYNAVTPNSASITFSYKEGVTGTSLISSFEENDYFVGSGVNSLTATFQPKPGLAAGVYEDIPMYVIMSDGSSHKIWLNLVITGLASQVEPVPDPDTGSVVVNGTYGDTIELTVQVSKAAQGKPKGRMTMPAVDTAAFFYGETLLGEADVSYDERTHTTGTATLRYDTTGNGIPVGDGREVTVAYGGSVNLLASTGTITVNLKAKAIAADETVEVNGVLVTGPAAQDEANAYVNKDGKVEVNGEKFTVTSGTVVVTKDGTVEIPKDATVTTPEGQTITGPATISADGKTVTVQTGGKITDGDKEYTVTTGPVTVTDGALTVPEDSVITDGKTTIAGPATVDPDNTTQDLPEGSSTTVGDTTVTVTGGDVTIQEDGSIDVPGDATVTVGDVTITGPATVDPDGETTVDEGGVIVNGETTVEVEEGSVTLKPDGSIEIPEEAEVTVNDIPVTGPASIDAEGQTITVEKDGSFTIGKDTYTVSKGTASVSVGGTAYVPEGSSVTVNGKTYDGPLTIGEDGIRFIYKIIKGANATVRKGKTLTVTANIDYTKFDGVLIDGVKLAQKHYGSKSGSTIVTLSADYIESLKTGRPYTITILANNGEATTTFTVKPASASSSSSSSSDKDYDSDSPKTGDITNTQTWMLLALVGLAGILATLLTKKFLLKRK